MKRLRDASLLTKFALLTAAVVLLIMGSGQYYAQRQARQALIGRLFEKAKFIDNFYAYVVADALYRQDDVTLLQAVGVLEVDPEITSVIVVDKKSHIRYAADPAKVGTEAKDSLIEKVLASGDGISTSGHNAGGETLLSVAPLKVQGVSGPIGAMRIEYTFHYLNNQLDKVLPSFKLSILGAVFVWVGLLMTFVRRAVILPLEVTKARLKGVNPGLLDANFPEGTDEFGQLNAALNELLGKLKSELAGRHKELNSQGDREQHLFELLRGFLSPSQRVLLVDKDNQLVSDSGDAAGQEPAGRHLLDLITDANFANLVADAFQNEGRVAQGAVVWQEHAYQASIIHLPESSTQLIRTLIALQATTTHTEGTSV